MEIMELMDLWKLGAKFKVRMHVEKFECSGETPERIEYLIADDEGRLMRSTEE